MTEPAKNTVCLWYDGGAKRAFDAMMTKTKTKIDIAAIEAARRG